MEGTILSKTSQTGVRWAFMGSDAIALPALEMLVSDSPVPMECVGVFTQPDRAKGRGMHLQENAIKRWAKERGIPVRQPDRCGDADCAWIAEKEVELIIVMAYGQILRKPLLALPSLGVLNLHASLLPRLRGASPIATAIACGYRETGVSLMKIVPKLDAGPVCDAEKVKIDAEVDGPGLADAISRACVPLLRRALPAVISGNAKFIEQNESEVSYCRIIRKTDAALDFRRTATELHDHIRAFQPWPGAQFIYEDVVVKVGATKPLVSFDRKLASGTLVVEECGNIAIHCGEGVLQLFKLQRAGGKMLAAAEFLRGFPMRDGKLIESMPMEPLEKMTHNVA
jgi:methionyl-tRNA formyltransferase